MTRHARRRERGGVGRLLLSGLAASGAALARNPAIAGGTTAFLVALFYVSANALWYQPHSHAGAWFQTRGAASEDAPPAGVAPTPRPEEARSEPAAGEAPRPAEDRTAVAVPAERENVPTGSVPDEESAEAPKGDPTVREVQTVLGELDLYAGPIDGLAGPETESAIKTYRRVVGLDVNAGIDDRLLGHLGIEESGVEAVPAPTARPEADPATEDQTTTASVPEPDPTIKRVQAGLKAFGNDDITIDGIMGERTRAAIREFQSLFGLPVTGKPDETFLAKMREVGLTD